VELTQQLSVVVVQLNLKELLLLFLVNHLRVGDMEADILDLLLLLDKREVLVEVLEITHQELKALVMLVVMIHLKEIMVVMELILHLLMVLVAAEVLVL
tara:strand:- start:168 stop:464 length:297 start_codon:yes stop_codon:yes gene_type:complete